MPSFKCAMPGLLLLAGIGPALALPPALPTIPPGTTNILSFGAVGDGVTTNTAAIQNAINAASAAGIGTVEIPAGVFLSGPFTLASSINLHLDAGAVLRMLPYGQYPGGAVNPPNFISGSSLHDVEISGLGAMDGQGLPWWKISETNSAANRPLMVNLSACSRVLIQESTLSNSPSMFFSIKGRGGNVTMQNLNILAPSSSAVPNPSHNTDALDLAETNCLIQNCYIAVGDDNLAVGSTASASSDILVTNCTFGVGHGVSIGSNTAGGVSNLTVVNCTFTDTDQGIRIKSDRDRGGLVQNLLYYNLTMSNVQYPILIYGSYTNTSSVYRNLNNITPAIAASYPPAPVTGRTPIYRDILISNVTATTQSGRMAGLIWGLPEMLITNLTLANVNITGSKTLGIYYAQGVRLVDSQIIVPSSVSEVSFYDAQITFSNSVPSGNVVTLDGVSTNGIGSALLLYNTQATIQKTNALAGSPGLTLSASTLTVSNNLNLDMATPVNFVLGASPATMAVASKLVANSVLNLSAGNGFGSGAYTLFTSGGSLSGNPTLGAQPPGYLCSLETNTPGQLKVQVTQPSPPAITTQPSSVSVTAGKTAVFQVTASGTPTLVYQWTFNGSNLPGATSSTFTLPNVQMSQAGPYAVTVTNSFGAITSAVATLTVFPPPPIQAWGDNYFGQCEIPPTITNALAISAGAYHALAVRADGRVVAWGNDANGQCEVPPDLTNAMAVAGGGYHSLALRSDGTIAAWGDNFYGQLNVPTDATNVAAISAGGEHSLALKLDGTVLAWGSDDSGQTDVPASATNVIAIAAGGQHSLALRGDGTVLAWGSQLGPYGDYAGQASVPAELNQVLAIAAGGYHSLALQIFGAVVAWGDNSYGQSTIPANLSNVVAIAAGGLHSLALLPGGAVTGWGDDLNGQISFNPGLSDITLIAAGGYNTLTLAGQPAPGLWLPNPVRSGKTLVLTLPTTRGKAYFLQYKNPLTDDKWLWCSGLLGDGSPKSFTQPVTNSPSRFYRVRQQ